MAVITGAHAIVFAPDPDTVRAFFRDVLELPSVDAGGGWPIFALPPAELAVHPGDETPRHAIYLMCDDIEATVEELRGKGVQVVGPITEVPWGKLAALIVPGGAGELALYEPRHPRPAT
jgi:predicted enzyme related to lactoylglutathione lyase